MTGKAQQVNVIGLHVNGIGSRRLGGVHQQEQVVLAADAAHLSHGQQAAHHVGAVVEDDHHRVRPDRRLHVGRVEKALGRAGHHRQLDPFPFQGPQRPHHRVVLHGTGDDVVAGSQIAAQGQVEPLRRVVAEDDAQRVLDVEEFSHRLAGLVDDAPCLHAQPVPGTARVGPHLLHEMHHGLGDTRWLGPGGGRVVEIDHVQLPQALP